MAARDRGFTYFSVAAMTAAELGDTVQTSP
jgi:hypothetical protein